MKSSKLILLIITNINASRIKQDLLPAKEQEILVLLQDKIDVVDKLIRKAKIYKKEKDPLIQKDFFNTPSAFVTIYRLY